MTPTTHYPEAKIMNIKMLYPRNLARVAVAAAVTSTLALSGCATLPGGAPGGTPTVQHGAIMGAAMGCGAGALVGLLHGGNLVYLVKGCAVGAAAGALTGAALAYHDEVVAAQAIQAQAAQAHAVATVRLRTISTTNGAGQQVKAQALDRLSIALDPSDVLAHGPATAGLLQKAANLAAASKDPVHIVVSGTLYERTWIAQTLLADLGNNPGQVSVAERYAATPTLTLTPIPAVPARAGA